MTKKVFLLFRNNSINQLKLTILLFILLFLFTVWLTDLKSGVYTLAIWVVATTLSCLKKKNLLSFSGNSFLALYSVIILGLFIVHKASLFTVIFSTFVVLSFLYLKNRILIVDEEKLPVKGLKSFLKDFEIIENFFKNEFQIFYGLKQAQVMLVFVYVFSSFFVDFNYKMDFFFNNALPIAAFFLFNSVIFSFIIIVRFFIVEFCNPIVDYKTTQKFIFAFFSVVSMGLVYAYLDFAATSGIIEPAGGLFTEVTKSIQNSQLGFSSKTSTGVVTGKAHLILFPNESVPTTAGVIDLNQTNKRLWP